MIPAFLPIFLPMIIQYNKILLALCNFFLLHPYLTGKAQKKHPEKYGSSDEALRH
jgi:hypothetical protein